jgi:CRISPR/Cas system-associated endonuclease/helicase Cas3
MSQNQNKLTQYLHLSEKEIQTLKAKFASPDRGRGSEAEEGVAFLEHLLAKFNEHIAKGGKILLITLTKKSSEEVTNFLVSKGYKAFYLHSEVATMDRREIIKKLKS